MIDFVIGFFVILFFIVAFVGLLYIGFFADFKNTPIHKRYKKKS